MGSTNNKSSVTTNTVQKKRTLEQKVGFVFIAISSFIAIVLGGVFTLRNIGSPFEVSYEGPVYLTETEKAALQLEQQKTQDTDEDGLTDYEEIYAYKTSAYLRDTDGDGYSDAVEVQAGTDPLCAGDDCTASEEALYVEGSLDLEGIAQMVETSNQVVEMIPTVTEEATVQETSEEIPDELPEMSIEDIRTLLISAGGAEEEVEALSDDEVWALYEKAFEEIQQEQM